MRNAVNKLKPLFNNVKAAEFEKKFGEMVKRPQSEIEERRYNEPTAKYVEEFVPEKFLNEWLSAKTKFIKAAYFWKATEVTPPYNSFSTFHRFILKNYPKLWEQVLLSAETGKEKFFIKIPHRETFPTPVVAGTKILDRKVIAAEVKDIMKLLKIDLTTNEQCQDLWSRALSAYHNE